MKLKVIRLLLLSTAVVLLVACGNENQTADIPTPLPESTSGSLQSTTPTSGDTSASTETRATDSAAHQPDTNTFDPDAYEMNCSVQVLGETIYDSILHQDRVPTAGEMTKLESCLYSSTNSTPSDRGGQGGVSQSDGVVQAFTPELEACLRGVLSPEAFIAVFETGSRNESATESSLLDTCFEAQGQDQGQRPEGSGRQQEDAAQALTPELEACLRGVLSPEAFIAVFETGSRNESTAESPLVGTCFETHGQGQGQDQGQRPEGSGRQQGSEAGGFFSQAKACINAALGANSFTNLMGESKRQPKADEAALIDICQSADSVQGDMPVYDLRSVFNPTLYPRKYPDKVVGTGGAAWFELMDLLDNDVEVARFRRAGINTLTFTILYDLDDSGVPVIKRSKEAANLIIRAKIRGFAVFVNLDTFTNQIPCSGSYEDNRASWHDIERRAAVALATFAQQLNVEYISPDNESESGLQGDCLDPLYSQTSGRDPYQQMLDPLGEEGFTARVGVMSAWHVELLPALREIFDGKIIAHFGNSHPEIYVPEYDGLTFTLDHGHLSAEQFRAHVRTDYLSADSAARESGNIQWMTWAYLPFSLEADFNDPEHPDYDPNYQPDPVEDQRMLEMQQVYIQASVDELPDLRGYILQGWLDKGLEIRGSEAEVILSNTFGTS